MGTLALALFAGALVGAGAAALVRGVTENTLGAVLAFIIIFGLVFGGVAALDSATTIQYGTVGAVNRFGRLTGRVLGPGLHWLAPFIESAETLPTALRSYETSEFPEDSGADFTDFPVAAQTVDGQQVSIRFTVLFYIPEANIVPVLETIGPLQEVVENIIKAYSRNLTRLLAQSYTAEDLYGGSGILAYQAEVERELREACAEHGIALESFLVRKVDFDIDYINAIEQQQIAQEDIQTAEYQAQAAQYEGERRVTLALADADALRASADAEAYGIEARGRALRAFPETLRWEFVSHLDAVEWGIMPTESITAFLPLPLP